MNNTTAKHQRKENSPVFFLNTRPRGTNVWREALLFDRLKDAIADSSYINTDTHDFIITNRKGSVAGGNTANMLDLIKVRNTLSKLLERGVSDNSLLVKSMMKQALELATTLKVLDEYCLHLIIDGVIV